MFERPTISETPSRKSRQAGTPWSVGTPAAKGEPYRWLKLEWPTDGARGLGVGRLGRQHLLEIRLISGLSMLRDLVEQAPLNSKKRTQRSQSKVDTAWDLIRGACGGLAVFADNESV